MASISRRDAAKLLLAGSTGLLVTAPRARGVEYIDSVIHGVQIGSVTYSFRPLDLDATLEGFRAVGLGECELWDAQVEPHDLKGEALAKWRLTTPLSYFQEVRQKLDRAGVLPYAYSVGPHT